MFSRYQRKSRFNYTGIHEISPGRLLYIHEIPKINAMTVEGEKVTTKQSEGFYGFAEVATSSRFVLLKSNSFSDPIQSLIRAEIKSAINGDGAGHQRAVEGVLSEDLELFRGR